MPIRNLEQHLKIVGWCDIAGSSLFLAAGAYVFLFFTGMGFAAHDPEALPILGLIGTLTGGFLLAVALPGLVAGWGLLTGKAWSRMLAIMVAALLLFAVPIGTVLGAYALWVLTSDEARERFETAALESTSP